MSKLSIWSSAAYAGVGRSTDQASTDKVASANASSSRMPSARRACSRPTHSAPRFRAASARSASRFDSRAAMVCRLSYSRLPVARAISTLAYPSEK